MSEFALPPSTFEPEVGRLTALRACGLLDSGPDTDFDALTRLAAGRLAVPMAWVALIDAQRVWVKSSVGLGVSQWDRQHAWCEQVMRAAPQAFCVDDVAADGALAQTAALQGAPLARAYAAVALVDEAGHVLGTLACADASPRVWTQDDRRCLQDLAVLGQALLASRRLASALSRMTVTDSLTGLANQGPFDEALEVELRHAMRTGEPFTVLTLDLDGFKEVNEGFGREAGDEVLREVSRRLREQVRLGDVLARLGCNEFGVVMRHGGKESARVLAKRVVRAVSAPITLSSGDTVGVGVSVGMAAYSDAVESVRGLLKQAHQALYEAKKQNERRWKMFVGG